MVPSAGLDRVVVTDALIKSLREIVQFEKARLVSQHVKTIRPYN